MSPDVQKHVPPVWRLEKRQTNSQQSESVTAADADSRIAAQLVPNRAVAVPLHFALVNGQNVTVTRRGNDVAFSDLLFDMRAGDRDVFVVRVIVLGLLFDDLRLGHGRADRHRCYSSTHY